MINLLLAIVVSASIDSTMLMLGDQTDLHLSVTHEASEQVQMPVYGEMLQEGIEIVDRSAIDTTALPDGRVQMTQDLTLTSFKDSLFAIQPLYVTSGEDTFWTEPMALNVIQPFEVDSSLAITDIKDIEKAPIWWWGIIRWILLVLGILLLIDLAFWLWKWYEKHHQPAEETIDPELLRPADEVALEKLDEIKAQKIWKDGKVKEYQTELTDVVREYIGRRFDVHSTEKTSDETLQEMKSKVDKDLYTRLKSMLQLADLVKFAKWHTTPDENEIVDIFSDFLSRAGLGSKVVFVTGIYARTAKQSYGGWFYDTLRDQNSDQELSLMIPQGLRDDLENGSLVTVGGTVYKKAGNRGNIQLGFKVSRVETLQQQAVSEEDMKRAELRARKTQRGFANVDAVLEGILMRGERPKVALIFAASSITMADFDAGKHAAEASMDFTEYRVNFSSAKDLCDLLSRVDGEGYDVLALVRGGGSGIEHLDDLAVLEKVVSLDTPLICAVGHVDEKLFLSPYGVTGESMMSPLSGYGNRFILGRVVAPLNMMISVGLSLAGKTKEAALIARRFCRRCDEKGCLLGFAPYDYYPLTGEKVPDLDEFENRPVPSDGWPWATWSACNVMTMLTYVLPREDREEKER